MSQSRILPALTGLRGICALWVLTYHSRDFIPDQDLPIVSMGWMGVDVFFILSGFIISHVHITEFRTWNIRTFLRFYATRLSRIYPVHVFTMGLALIYLLMRYVAGATVSLDRFSVSSLLQNILLVHSWFSGRLTWNYVSWSISAEWAVYLLFPFIATFVSRISSPINAIAGFAVCLAAMILVLWNAGYPDTFIIVGYTVPRAFGEFTGGCFLYAAYRSGRLDHLPWGHFASAAVLTIALLCFVKASSFWMVPVIGVLILSIAYGKGGVAALLSTRSCMFLGEVSYSLYMVHFLVLEILLAPVQLTRLGSMGRIILYPAYIFGLIGVAIATIVVFNYIEKPGRLAMRRLLLSRVAPTRTS